MKKLFSFALMSMLAASMLAENIQTVVFSPSPKMVCENCEKKIKTNLRFVKGTKTIETSLKDNTVTIRYDADKAKPEAYVEAMAKIGRKAEVVTPAASSEKKSK